MGRRAGAWCPQNAAALNVPEQKQEQRRDIRYYLIALYALAGTAWPAHRATSRNVRAILYRLKCDQPSLQEILHLWRRSKPPGPFSTSPATARPPCKGSHARLS